MTTHLDEIKVYLRENRVEIKSNASKTTFAAFELDIEEALLSEVKTCKAFRIFYNKEDSSSNQSVADLRLTKVFPKLESIDVFYCSVQPSDVLKFLKDSSVKVGGEFNFTMLPIPESEKNALTTFMINYTEKYIRTFGINFSFFWLWDYYKTRGKHIYVDMVSESDMIEYFNKILDDGIPLGDPEGFLNFHGYDTSNLEYFVMIFSEMIERGSVEVHTKRVGDKQIFDLELKKADDKKLFVKIDDDRVIFSHTMV